MRSFAIVLGLAACGAPELAPDAMPVPPDAPDGCTPPEDLAEIRLTVGGTVRDLVTGAPVVGATVDVAKAWTPRGFPASDCPVLATLMTDAAGQFGPVEIAAGPGEGVVSTGQFLAFLVTGPGVASTVSDVRYRCRSACTLPAHAIAVPRAGLAAEWRTELAASGMPDAAARGLVAFTYNELDGTPASGVEALALDGALFPGPLERGTELRYVADDGALAPVEQPGTLARGLAVLGIETVDGEIYVGGRRGEDAWTGTGSIVAPGWIFVEDKTVRAPSP